MIERFERFSVAISEISRHWHKLTTDEMEKHGLKGPHAVYLMTLAKHPEGLTAPQLCQVCAKDKADVSRMMSIMEEKGLVKKEGIYQNLYKGVFILTEKGVNAAKQVGKRATLAVELAGKDMDDESRAIFYDGLESIAKNLCILSKEGIPDVE